MVKSTNLKVKDLMVLRELKLPPHPNVPDSYLKVLHDSEIDRFYIQRLVSRNNIKTLVDKYEFVQSDGNISILPLTQEKCDQIIDRLVNSPMTFNSCFVFHAEENDQVEMEWEKTEEEHSYTSTGIKFWRHQSQMEAFTVPVTGSPRKTVISSHISAEGKCNLRCPYCSVTYRDTHSRIPMDVIKKYVEDLMSRGLQAVILTGGGEPTLYPHFNELVQWLKKEKNLSVALITNGTNSRLIESETLSCFSWIRVSINIFPDWESKIVIPTENLDPSCIVGCSFVYTAEHEAGKEFEDDRLALFSKVSKVADNCGAQYVRLLPNCLLEQQQLIEQHISLQKVLSEYGDERFFQQFKIHGAPKSSVCHQAYFRPYLSEEPSVVDGVPGTVFPCDSVVLNESVTHFAEEFQLCKPGDILDFIDGKIDQTFDPRESCKGCVFTDNVNMLEDWKTSGVNRFEEFPEPLKHEEFV